VSIATLILAARANDRYRRALLLASRHRARASRGRGQAARSKLRGASGLRKRDWCFLRDVDRMSVIFRHKARRQRVFRGVRRRAWCQSSFGRIRAAAQRRARTVRRGRRIIRVSVPPRRDRRPCITIGGGPLDLWRGGGASRAPPVAERDGGRRREVGAAVRQPAQARAGRGLSSGLHGDGGPGARARAGHRGARGWAQLRIRSGDLRGRL